MAPQCTAIADELIVSDSVRRDAQGWSNTG